MNVILVLALAGCAADTSGQGPAQASMAPVVPTVSQDANDPDASGATTRRLIMPLSRQGGHPCEDKQRANAQAVLTWVNPVEDVALQFQIDGPGLAEEQATRSWNSSWNTVQRDNPVAMYCWTEAVITPLPTPPVPLADELVNNTEGMFHEQVSYPVYRKHAVKFVLPISIQFVVDNDRQILDPNALSVNVRELDPADVRETAANLQLELALPPGEYTFDIRPAYRDGTYTYIQVACQVSVDGYKCKDRKIKK